MKGLIIYDTVYGTTKRAAEEICEVLGNCELLSVDDALAHHFEVDYIVMGTHMHGEHISPKIMMLTKKYINEMKGKKVYGYVMNLEGDTGEKYLRALKEILQEDLILMQALPGKVEVEKLSPEDYEGMKKLFSKVGLPMKSMDLYRPEAVKVFAIDILADLQQPKGWNVVNMDKLIKYPNICVLTLLIKGAPYMMRRRFVYFEKKLYFIFEKESKPVVYDGLPVSLFIFTLAEKPEIEMEARITSTFKKVPYHTDEYRFVMHENGLPAQWVKENPERLDMFKVTLEGTQYNIC